MKELRIAGVVSDSIVDGPGLRLAVFTQVLHPPLPRLPESGDLGLRGRDRDERGRDPGEVKPQSAALRRPLTGGEPFEQAEALIAPGTPDKSRGAGACRLFRLHLSRNDGAARTPRLYGPA